MAATNPKHIRAGRVLSVVAGTAVQFPDVVVPYDFDVNLKALSTNGGIVYIGNSKPEAENPSRTTSFPMEANDELKLEIGNLNQLWIDAAVAPDGLYWIVEQH